MYEKHRGMYEEPTMLLCICALNCICLKVLTITHYRSLGDQFRFSSTIIIKPLSFLDCAFSYFARPFSWCVFFIVLIAVFTSYMTTEQTFSAPPPPPASWKCGQTHG